MAWFVEARDPYTGGHLWRVSRYARMLAAAAGLDAVEVARVSLGGFLHDLSKIGVPDAILCKSAPLTDAEWAVMRTHPDIGMRLLAAHPHTSQRAGFIPTGRSARPAASMAFDMGARVANI
ncbi:MAG: HD domain-containing protein [Thiomonas arsenitoxydans]|uniref:HD domain-containing protein n=2 Tax=Burkholderiales genera incertae sedis TaxID=224471 RepID=A0A8I1MYI5_THIA3|nr:HD domain-containing protein [Thiomonas arsenitoxydans]